MFFNILGSFCHKKVKKIKVEKPKRLDRDHQRKRTIGKFKKKNTSGETP